MSERDDPASVAEEQFVHGLLEFRRRDEARREERLARLLGAIEEAASPPARRGLPGVRRRLVTFAASALVLVTAVALFVRGETAHALVLESLEAMGRGPSRYHMEVTLTETPTPVQLVGELDVGGAVRRVMRLTTPHGLRAAIGRDEESAWIAHPGGFHLRLGTSRDWPPWLRLDEGVPLVDTLDATLAALAEGYALEHGREAPSVPESLVEVVGSRLGADGGRAERVLLWIERDTHLVARLELVWEGAAHTLEEFQREVEEVHGDHDVLDPAHPADFWEVLTQREFLAPRRIVFERVGLAELPADWFRPETHSR